MTQMNSMFFYAGPSRQHKLFLRNVMYFSKYTQSKLITIVLYCIYLFLSARTFQKRSRPQQLTLCWSLHAEALRNNMPW